MKDHIDDILALIALFILSVGVYMEYGAGLALIVFGSLMFATVLSVIIITKPKP